ncbi:DUF4189 domain-containing protein [Tumidithrix elongata RA019]|uniref:DUF4189 domain-containing protein n=1 Tax=Tumidithrix elongata BACA0141 TaxID=2716417 RepID=A0AAW9PXD4_9CYAN|nr:DUF4189 domain-containing protein [Tumidithrix elongata RA019]
MVRKFCGSLAIAATVVLPLVLSGGMDAYAQNSFGAIARSRSTQDKGYAWNYSSRAAAERSAISQCESLSGAGDCRILIWVRNACMSISEASNGAAGTAWSANAGAAEEKADEVCRDYGGRNCSTVRTICTPD